MASSNTLVYGDATFAVMNISLSSKFLHIRCLWNRFNPFRIEERLYRCFDEQGLLIPPKTAKNQLSFL